MSDIECAAWRKEVDKAVVSGWNTILKEAQDLRHSWQQAAAPVIAWRTRMEAGRGVLRVLLRAWREIVDDVRAGAAKWEGRWQNAMGTPIPVQKRYICECRYWTINRVEFWKHEHACGKLRASGNDTQVHMSHLMLARRLSFASDSMSMWETERGWRVRMLFAWQRLVRAGKVHLGRRRSHMWQEAERQRLATLAERYKQELRRNEEWVDDGTQIRGQQYSWDLEGDMQVQQNVSSGTAAVMVRRLHQTRSSTRTQSAETGSSGRHTHATSNKRGRQVETFNRAGTHDSTQLESDKNASRNANRESRQGAMTETQRSTDGMLFYTPLSLQRLHAQLQTSYYWRREPFGDG